ncbi:MAG TPA: flavin reductase family protein [Ktedonobacteraceae bacterium]|nr:flavin reductase family protein [Ktedonobacteraceae bacterium]
MALDITFFRRVMGQFTTGVTIVTTRSEKGIAGLTVNSFTSVSLNPLLVLVSIDLRSQSLPFLREGGIFAVNILTQEQEALARCFASSSEERYTYFCNAHHHVAATGAPILDGSLAFIDARITAEYPGGDHALFLGQVEAMGYDGQTVFLPGISSASSTLPVAEAEIKTGNGSNGHNGHHDHSPLASSSATPLVYYHGKYRSLSSHTPQPALSTTNQHEQK